MGKGSGIWWTCGQRLGQRLCIGESQGVLGHVEMHWAMCWGGWLHPGRVAAVACHGMSEQVPAAGINGAGGLPGVAASIVARASQMAGHAGCH